MMEKKKANKSATKTKKVKTGRPTDYKPEYAEQAEMLCKLGATDKDLAEFFKKADSTISKWKIDYPEFSEALKRGKELPDGEVVKSLYKRAMGYRYKEVELRPIDETDPDTGEGLLRPVKVIEKEAAPDTTAAIFWLKNRQKEKWRDKHDVEHSGNISNLSDEELKRRTKELADRL